MHLRDGYILKLIKLYESGDIEARNILLEMNYQMIKEKAEASYKLLKEKLKNYYQIQDYYYELPDYIISIDDIIQDFSIKTLILIEKYKNNKTNEYFSTYLNQMLTSYTKGYADNWFKKIINQEKNEFHQTIKPGIKPVNEEIKKIKFTFKNDFVLKKHEEFIDMIFSGYTMKELKKITGLDGRRLGMKINYLSQEYIKRTDNLISLYNLSEEKLCNLLLKGKIYQIEYYKKIIDECILNTIEKFCDLEYSDYIYYSDIYNYYMDACNFIIDKYFENNKFNLYKFNEIFIKKITVYKYKITINKLFNNKEKRIKNEKKCKKM